MSRLPLTLLALLVLASFAPSADGFLFASSESLCAERQCTPAPNHGLASRYEVLNFTFHNCDAGSPLRMDEMSISVWSGNFVYVFMRMSTTVQINSAILWDNGTYIPDQGAPFPDNALLDFNSLLTPPQALPLAAGTKGFLANEAVIAPDGLPSGTRTGIAHVYDEFMRDIGCFVSSYQVRATSNRSSHQLHTQSK